MMHSPALFECGIGAFPRYGEVVSKSFLLAHKIPVCIVVKHADDISIVVETYYLIFGHTEMLIGDDGPTYLRTLF